MPIFKVYGHWQAVEVWSLTGFQREQTTPMKIKRFLYRCCFVLVVQLAFTSQWIAVFSSLFNNLIFVVVENLIDSSLSAKGHSREEQRTIDCECILARRERSVIGSPSDQH
jgi:hypothetical protein